MKRFGLFAAGLALAGSVALGAQAGPEAWTKQALVAFGEEHASSLLSAKTSLQTAQDKADHAAPFWQSSVGASAQLWSSPNGSLSPSVGLSSSWKPLDQLSVDVSADLSGLKASTNVHPFSNSSSVTSAQQALDLERLRYENARASLDKAILTAYSQWVRTKLDLGIAVQDRDAKNDALEAEQIKYDVGKSSDSTIGDARLALLSSDKSLWSARATESAARDALFLAVGYTADDFSAQLLADPVLAGADDLLTRAKAILTAQTPVKPTTDLATARLRLEQAKANAAGWPSLLSGLAASGSYATSGNWSVGVNYSLSFSSLVSPQEDTLKQAVADAAYALRTAELQAASSSRQAMWNLQGSVSQLELSQKQVLPAQASLDAEKIRSSTGSSTAQKLRSLEINVLRAHSAVASAQADLEAQLLNW